MLGDYEKLTTKKFIERATQLHNNKFDYSLVEYKTAVTKIKIICPEHGVFEQTPNSHLRGYGCSKCKIITNEKFIKNYRKTYKSISFFVYKYIMKAVFTLSRLNFSISIGMFKYSLYLSEYCSSKEMI